VVKKGDYEIILSLLLCRDGKEKEWSFFKSSA